VCVLDESKGYVCQLVDPEIPCPKPTGICTTEYAPVVCGDCEYSNQCQANSAGFTSDTCKPKATTTDPPEVECKGNQDCESGYCYLGLGSPGIPKRTLDALKNTSVQARNNLTKLKVLYSLSNPALNACCPLMQLARRMTQERV
jgi:hypothetical protein